MEWLIAAADDTALDAVPPAIAAAAADLTADLRIDATAPGRYRLIRRLGEGGMGVVWLAEREVAGAHQHVALKRLRMGCVAQHARFHEEQRILAALSHPTIALLVDAGEDVNGDPFLALEYVEGERTDRWCDARALELCARTGLFLKVCAAAAHAHERLVIHRDLKPANALVDAAGEPKLLDFGIARLIGAEATATLAARAMTVAYASPEQIEGAPLGYGDRCRVAGRGAVRTHRRRASVRAHCHRPRPHQRHSRRQRDAAEPAAPPLHAIRE